MGEAASSPLSSQGRLPLAFMGLGLAWLAAATAFLAAHAWILGLPNASPPAVALAHAWILGFFATVAFGAVYQLAPVALGTALWSPRRAWWHFGLHAVGAPGMVYAFWRWDMALLGHFGCAVALGAGLFADNVWRTVRRSRRGGPVAWSLALAAAWLLLTVLAGLVVAANGYWHFIGGDPAALLRAHAHLGLIGFFATLLQGVAFQLVPMFTLGEVRDWRPAKAGLWLSQLGLLGLVPSLAWDSGPAAALFGSAVAAGFACSGWGLWRALAARRKRPLDPGVRAFARGMATLAAAGWIGVTLIGTGSRGDLSAAGPGAMAYGVIAVAGVLLPCVAGMMCKIVPFLTWMRAYGPRVGRGPTPGAGSLAWPVAERWGLALQGAAAIPLAAGAWLASQPLLRAGAWMLALGTLLFLGNMAAVLRHLWRPAVPQAAAHAQCPR